MIKIKEVMTTNPTYIPATTTIQEAAQKMAEMDCGFLPVGHQDLLVGVITDRDITIRATAKGLASDTPVSKIMSQKVFYCTEGDTAEMVAKNMGENQMRRMVVLDNKSNKKFTGIVAVADLVRASNFNANACHMMMHSISQGDNKTKKSKAA